LTNLSFYAIVLGSIHIVVWEEERMALRKGDHPRNRSKDPITEWDDSNWREESLPYHTGVQAELLKNGPKSLSQSWMMNALKQEWMRRNNYKHPDPPDVSSSMKEFFAKTKDQGI